VTNRRVKIAAGVAALLATAAVVLLLVRRAGGESHEEAIQRAEQLVRRGGFPCYGAPANAKPPLPEFFEGNRIYHRYVGTHYPDVARGLGQPEQINAAFLQARSERIRALSGAIWTAQSDCRGAFLLACSNAASKSGTEREARCEPWRAYARWSRDEVHFDLPEISLRQCSGCAYLFE
jgi:hypothetical protein